MMCGLGVIIGIIILAIVFAAAIEAVAYIFVAAFVVYTIIGGIHLITGKKNDSGRYY